jgi:winged helix DNA-binding protein
MTKLSWDQVLRWRLHRHFLAAEKAEDPVAVARRLSGVHAQVASAAVAAVGLRTTAPGTAKKLDTLLYERRTLVRTWAARGTLHLLPADDLPTWVAAMSTRTREGTGSWLRYNGVTAAQMKDLLGALPEVLSAEPLTREELADAIIAATGHRGLRERLTHGFGTLLKPGAFRGLLCSGPPRGRSVTLVAPRAWLPDLEWDDVDTDAAVDRLALAYLGAYGPAGPEEFARWFDLRPTLAKKAFARLAAAGETAAVEVDGTAGAVPADQLDALTAKPGRGAPTVLLLPAFDPYVVGSTRQLEAIGADGHKPAVSRPQGWISPTLVVDGWVRGVWAGDGGRPRVTPFAPLPAAVTRALGNGVEISTPS